MLSDDPLAAAVLPGARVSMLCLAAQVRRRNRVNGMVSAVTEDGFMLTVEQSFGNCPKYIHPRLATFQPSQAPLMSQAHPEQDHLSGRAQAMIAAANTLFIASLHPEQDDATGSRAQTGADVSHRGGVAGFVQIVDAQTLVIPDYSGNQYFNTLGNLLLNPSVGLLFIDYASAEVLWVSGHAEVIDDPVQARAYAGAERLLRVRVLASRLAHQPLPLSWQDIIPERQTPPRH
jgi:predicted pyridoxine 5'-phosphate oxidase superfamily flavin-nucleotide-binding protein